MIRMNMRIISWFFFKPLKFYVYKVRLRQGLNKEYAYKVIRNWDHKRVMAFIYYRHRS